MSQSFRHPDILEIVKREGKATVEQLAEHFGVTLQTIRRDLSELSETKKIERVHGGAILPTGTTNIEYDERRELNNAAKVAIARACSEKIPNGCSIFLNIGTSTEAVARQLLRHRDLLIVTNNTNVAAILVENTECQTILTGGKLRRADNGLVGNVAIQAIRQFRFDVAVIGCSALEHDGDIMDFDIEEVGVSQTIIAQSRQTFLVADASKFSRSAPARISSLRALTTVFTDRALPTQLQEKCRDWKTEVIVAS